MNTSKYKQLVGIVGLALFAFSVSSCTLGDVSGDSGNTLTEEDLQAAGQILGESLSSDNSGVILSLNDALSNISSDGFTPSTNLKSGTPTLQDDRSGRGSETEFSYSYDPATGTHTISFKREVQRPLFSKSVTDTLHYIFTDNSGTFIEFPRQQRDRIESITYDSHRQGEVSTLRRESFFVRKDTFLIDGVSDASPVLSIDGVHNGNGSMEIRRAGNLVERTYDLEINFLNIEIQKSSSGEINVSRGVTGTLSWEMIIERTSGNRSDSKTLRGTIELNGDGTALLRFRDYLEIFQINLDDGDVNDTSREFEGRVQSVNVEQQTVTFVNGRTVYLTENTQFDDDQYTSLESVQRALENGIQIWAEVEGTVQNSRFMVSEIEFEDEDDGTADNVEFEALISSVNISANTFTLGGGAVIQINEDTIIDESGDYLTLQAVSDALSQGIRVEADGEGVPSSSGNSDLTALDVEFEREED